MEEREREREREEEEEEGCSMQPKAPREIEGPHNKSGGKSKFPRATTTATAWDIKAKAAASYLAATNSLLKYTCSIFLGYIGHCTQYRRSTNNAA